MRLLGPYVLILCFAAACAARQQPGPPPGEESIDPLARVPGEFLYEAGVTLARRGEWLRAEQYLTASIARGYPEEEVVPWLVEVCVRDSRYRSALLYAHPYLRRQPQDWRMRLLVASVHLGLEEPDAAERELSRALQQAPDAPEAHYLMAIVHRDGKGDPGAAVEHFQRYLQLAPSGDHAAEARVGAAWTASDDTESTTPSPSSAEDSPAPAPVQAPTPTPVSRRESAETSNGPGEAR